jgi:hypothetical protein
MITKGTPDKVLEFFKEEIMKLTHQDLDKGRAGLLNLKDKSYLAEFLAQI